MALVARTCPACGAPLKMQDGRCAYCHQALAWSDVEGVVDAPFSMRVDEVGSEPGQGELLPTLAGRINSGRVRRHDVLVVDTDSGERQMECREIDIGGDFHLLAEAGTSVRLILRAAGDPPVRPKDLASGGWVRGAD